MVGTDKFSLLSQVTTQRQPMCKIAVGKAAHANQTEFLLISLAVMKERLIMRF